MNSRILTIAENLYEAVPDREFVKLKIPHRVWKCTQKDIDEALDIIESKVQSSKGKITTFNGHRGTWITDDLKLRFVREGEEYDKDSTKPKVYDPTTLDANKIWEYIKKDLDPKTITEELRKNLVEKELQKRRNLALFLYYLKQSSQAVNGKTDETLKKLNLQHQKLLDSFEIRNTPSKSFIYTTTPITKSTDVTDSDKEKIRKTEQQIWDILDSKQVITKERLQPILTNR